MDHNKSKSSGVSKKRKRHPFKKFLSLVMFTVACFLTYNVVMELTTTVQLKRDIADNEAELSKLNKESGELSKTKKNLEDPEYVKRYARGKYMVTKGADGEQVFKLPSKE
ncbi:MAG: septum formation initiator family protein [Erysipelotrichaceae bacterium]